jgi:hypothetical protein
MCFSLPGRVRQHQEDAVCATGRRAAPREPDNHHTQGTQLRNPCASLINQIFRMTD